MRHALLALALTLAACTAEPEPIAPAVEPAPAAPAPAPAEPAPEPVALTATVTAEGGTVSATGTSNLPDGAVLVWELYGDVDLNVVSDELYEQRLQLNELMYELMYADGRIEGSVQVTGGTYALTVTGERWDELGLCEQVPLELWVSYYPYAELAERGAFPAQPDSLYALHGEQGELITGAVPPAELVERNSPEMGFSQRVELTVTCP
jgi:hypothetical protein